MGVDRGGRLEIESVIETGASVLPPEQITHCSSSSDSVSGSNLEPLRTISPRFEILLAAFLCRSQVKPATTDVRCASCKTDNIEQIKTILDHFTGPIVSDSLRGIASVILNGFKIKGNIGPDPKSFNSRTDD